MPAELRSATPILPVASLLTSLDYYVNVLGFQADWEDPGIIASVARDRCSILLCQGDQGHPGTWVWIAVPDAEALFNELRERGARIRMAPTNYWWACEFQIEDPDGNVLRFGADPKADQPCGPWRDMHGAVWERTSDGKWQRSETG